MEQGVRWTFFRALAVFLSLAACHSARWENHNTPEEDLAFRRLLQSGDPEAMYQMGFYHFAKPGVVRYPNGQVVDEEDNNYGGAIKWFKRAAEAGHVGAMIQTANIYSQGMGRVPRDLPQAAYWYSRAFEKGERDYSPYWLGEYHMRGEAGLTQDFSSALYYFNQAYGSYPLEKLLARTDASTDQIPTSTRFAIYGTNALRRISLFYRCGWGVPIDEVKAYRILSQCAKYLEGSAWCRRDAEQSNTPCVVPGERESAGD